MIKLCVFFVDVFLLFGSVVCLGCFVESIADPIMGRYGFLPFALLVVLALSLWVTIVGTVGYLEIIYWLV